MKKTCLLVFLALGLSGLAQIELTPKEQAYQDSINRINASNAATAEAQTAYNDGINLFSSNDFSKAIAAFDKAIAGDPNFQAAYYNKGVAPSEIRQFK
jgi:tetratricopeptide (TPR) repeat protein